MVEFMMLLVGLGVILVYSRVGEALRELDQLKRKLSDLQTDLYRYGRRANTPEPARPEPARPEPARPEHATVETATVETATSEHATSEHATVETATVETATSEHATVEPAAPEPATAEPVIPRPSRRKTATPSKSTAEWEMLIGGTWLNRIGAIAVLIGTIFFLKYAFDNDLIGEWGRIIIGLVAGGGLVVGGHIARRKSLVIFSQGLVGSGIPILYFSVYAAYEFYSLLPFTVAFLCMAVIGALALFIALKHDAPFIAMLGAVGGMVTPAVLSTGHVNTPGLFTFLALLDLALMAIALQRRKWWFLDVIVTVGTWGWWLLWMFEVEHHIENEIYGDVFIWVFLVGFAIYDRFIVANGDLQYPRLNRLLSMYSMFCSSLALAAVSGSQEHWRFELPMVIAGLVFYAAGLDIQRNNWTRIAASIRFVAAVLVLLFTPVFHEDPEVILIWWSVIGTAGVFAFRKMETSGPLWTAAAIFPLALIVVVASSIDSGFATGAMPVVNWRTGPLLLVLLGALISIPQIVGRPTMTRESRIIFSYIRAALVACFVGAIWYDTVDFGRVVGVQEWEPYLYRAGGSVIVLVAGLCTLWWGRRIDDAPLHGTGMTVVGAGLLLVLSDVMPSLPDTQYAIAINVRSITAIIHILGLIVCLRWSALQLPSIPPITWRQLVGVPIGIMVFALLSYEVFTPFRITDQPSAAQLALSSTWFLYGLTIMLIGFSRRSLALRIGGLVLLAIAILKVFLYDLGNLQQPYRIISFIGLGVILLIASFLYTRYKDRLFEQE